MGIPEFNKQLDITTKDKKTVSFIKQEILIHDSSSFDGQATIVKEGSDILLIKEIYQLENNRLRFSYDKYENVKAYNTIETKEDGSEAPIMVIEAYDNKQTYIGSIGNIINIKSDLGTENKKSDQNKDSKILKLIREKLIKTNENEKKNLAA